MDKIHDFLLTQDVDALWEDDAVVWIDWREDDEDIVSYCETMLQTGALSSQCKDVDNALGYEMSIIYQGKTQVVDFHPEDINRDATLIALNEVLSPDYQIRLWMDSVGGDTLAFVPLPTSAWRSLEQEFGTEKVAHHFAPVTSNSRMFALSMNEVMDILKVREAE